MSGVGSTEPPGSGGGGFAGAGAGIAELPEHGLRSAPLEPAAYDCVVIVTAHSSIDYDRLADDASLVVDLRNATGRNGSRNGKVWKL